MNSLGCLFLFLFAIVIGLFAAVRNIVYTLIGRPPRTQSRRQTTGHDRTTQEKKNTSKTKKDANKIFGKDEGEYVDFEEIKD